MADNAATAARIKAKLLRKLEREIDALPDNMGSEVRKSMSDSQYDKKNRPTHTEELMRAYKLRDLTAAYKDLTDDMPKEEDSSTLEKLDRLLEVAWDAAHT